MRPHVLKCHGWMLRTHFVSGAQVFKARILCTLARAKSSHPRGLGLASSRDMSSHSMPTPEGMSARIFMSVVFGTLGFFVAMALLFLFMKG